jgi:DNA-binding CsgD family transcriptional regulator
VDETTAPMKRAALLPAYVEVLLAVSELDAARRACAELAEIAARVASVTLGAVSAQARGAVLLAEGDARGALVALRDALQVWQELKAPYEVARVRVLLGLACRALGDADTATLELEAAGGTFAQLGAAPDVERVDSLAHGPAPDVTHGLTARELQVLRLVAMGRTNREIAAELVLSEKTVDRHLSNILAKLRVPSRTAATAYAYRHDLM